MNFIIRNLALVFGVLIWLTVVLTLVSFFKKAARSSRETVKKPAARPQFRQAEQPGKDSVSLGRVRVPKALAKGYGMSSLGSGGVLMEDRNNDWLAKQIREEQRMLLRGDMTDLGAVHDRACSADLLKMYHVEECDAGSIDSGSYKVRA